MIEAYAEFDLVCGDYATGYFYGDDMKDCLAQVERELITWGGGHADIFDDDGEFYDWVEI